MNTQATPSTPKTERLAVETPTGIVLKLLVYLDSVHLFAVEVRLTEAYGGLNQTFQCANQGAYTINGIPYSRSGLFAWLCDRVGPVQVVLHPDVTKYGLVQQAEFTDV